MQSTMLQGTPLLYRAVYDGDSVWLDWTPSLTSATGYVLNLARSSSPGVPIASSQIDDPTQGSGAVAFPLAAADRNPGNWQASVVVAGGSKPQSNTVTLPAWVAGQAGALLPALTNAVRHPDGSISIAWKPVAASAPPAFAVSRYRVELAAVALPGVVAVDIDGASASQAWLAPGPAFIGASGSQLRIIGLNSVNGGVATPAIDLISDAPSILSVDVSAGVASVSWQPGVDPLAQRYVPTVYALEDGFVSAVQGAATDGGSGRVTLPRLDASKHYVASVIAIGNDSARVVGFRSNDVPVLTQAPALTLFMLDRDRLSIGWAYATAAEDAARRVTRVELVDSGGGVLFATDSTSNGGVFGIPRIDGAFDLRLTPLGASGAGPATVVPAPVAQVQTLSIQTDPIRGNSTLQWARSAGAGFQLRWRADSDAIRLPAGTESLPLDAAQQADGELAPSLRVVTAIGSVQALGPAVQIGALPPAPATLECDFNGSTLSAEWSPVEGATGYVLTVYQGASAVSGWPITLAAADLSWQGAFEPAAGEYRLAVQALRDGATSLARSCDLFEAGWFIGSATKGSPRGYIYPATSMATTVTRPGGPVGERIDLWLPPLCASAHSLAVSVGAFVLTDNSAGGADFPYVLTIAADSAAWQFDGSALRSGLQLDYQNFLIAAEHAGVSAYGISVLQDAIARHMPQTFAESLYYAYGLVTPNADLKVTQTRFELRPGMLLSVSAASYQRPAASGGDSRVNGYALTGITHFDVQSYAGSNVLPGIDGFISTLAALDVLTVNPPNQTSNNSAGIAAAADVYYSAFAQSYWCVLVPKVLQSASDVESSQWVQQFVLASSASYADLTRITDPPGATPAVYFRGRSVLSPGLRVSVNGSERIVAVGTTVGNVLSSLGRRPGATAQPTSVQLLRGIGAARRADALAQSAQSVRFDFGGVTSWGLALDSFDLPLLPGDVIDVI